MMPTASDVILCVSWAWNAPRWLQSRIARVPRPSARLEHRVDRKDLSRLTEALGAHCVARYPEPPAAIVLDLDHTDDPTAGQQELACDNH